MFVPKSYIKLFTLLMLFCAIAFISACSRQGTTAPPDAVSAATTDTNHEKAVATPINDERPIILAFGDSLTEGYGLPRSKSYPTLLQKRLDENGYKYRVVNAGISGDTSFGGLNRIDEAIKSDNIAVMILELGGNDMLRGLDLTNTGKNLATIIEKVQAKHINVILAGMEAPPNLGEDTQREFHDLYVTLAEKYKLKRIPFFLEGVGGRAELNQDDKIHPNENGTPIVMENVWKVLEPLLKK